jgi:hypothetical protein
MDVGFLPLRFLPFLPFYREWTIWGVVARERDRAFSVGEPERLEFRLPPGSVEQWLARLGAYGSGRHTGGGVCTHCAVQPDSGPEESPGLARRNRRRQLARLGTRDARFPARKSPLRRGRTVRPPSTFAEDSAGAAHWQLGRSR